jgi:SAM-dependent methyltransferase
LLDAGHLPTGLDFSAAMLERCARRARPIPLHLADFWRSLAFADGSFDAAVALHGTLAHPPDSGAIARLSREVARVVRPGGTWIIEAPAPGWLDRLDAVPPAGGHVVRTGPRTCVYEDGVVGVSIEARLLDDDEWRAALGEGWAARVEPLGEREWLVVARRAR